MPGVEHLALDGTQDLKAQTMEMTMKSAKAPGRQMVLRMVDGAVYVDAGQARAAGGKRWLKMDMKQLAKTTGQSANPFTAAGPSSQQQNPAAQAALLSRTKSVKKLGTETVNGTRTTHYQGTFDINALEAARLNEQQTKALEKFKAMKVSKITMDLWATSDHQLVKFRQQATTAQGPLDLTTTVKNINAPVHIQAPPADQTQYLAQASRS